MGKISILILAILTATNIIISIRVKRYKKLAFKLKDLTLSNLELNKMISERDEYIKKINKLYSKVVSRLGISTKEVNRLKKKLKDME